MSLHNLTVTAGTSDFSDLFYAEQPDRVGAVGVLWTGHIERGQTVSVSGRVLTHNGERLVEAQVVSVGG